MMHWRLPPHGVGFQDLPPAERLALPSLLTARLPVDRVPVDRHR